MKKRGREGEETKDSSEKTAKKQDLSHQLHDVSVSDNNAMEESSNPKEDDKCEASDECLALGIFDFPWLKEGMIYKPEDWCLEDTFCAGLHDICDATSMAEVCGQSWQTVATISMPSFIDVPSEKFEEDVWRLEMESVQDCTRTPLLQQETTDVADLRSSNTVGTKPAFHPE